AGIDGSAVIVEEPLQPFFRPVDVGGKHGEELLLIAVASTHRHPVEDALHFPRCVEELVQEDLVGALLTLVPAGGEVDIDAAAGAGAAPGIAEGLSLRGPSA